MSTENNKYTRASQTGAYHEKYILRRKKLISSIGHHESEIVLQSPIE